MALSDILQKIMADAQQVVAQIKTDAAAELETIQTKAADLQKQDKKESDQKTKEAIAQVEQKVEQLARRENAKKIAQIKRSMIQEILENCVARISTNLSAENAKALAAPFVGKPGTILVPTAQTELYQGLDINIKGDDSIPNGIRYVEEKIQIDRTIESLINNEFRSELEIYIAEQFKWN